MCLLRRHQRLRVGIRACNFCLASLTALLLTPALAAKTGKLSGSIFAVGQDQVQIVCPNARITLKNLTTHNEVSGVSNDVGMYVFAGVQVERGSHRRISWL
jgi:hypothetical protein